MTTFQTPTPPAARPQLTTSWLSRSLNNSTQTSRSSRTRRAGALPLSSSRRSSSPRSGTSSSSRSNSSSSPRSGGALASPWNPWKPVTMLLEPPQPPGTSPGTDNRTWPRFSPHNRDQDPSFGSHYKTSHAPGPGAYGGPLNERPGALGGTPRKTRIEPHGLHRVRRGFIHRVETAARGIPGPGQYTATTSFGYRQGDLVDYKGRWGKPARPARPARPGTSSPRAACTPRATSIARRQRSPRSPSMSPPEREGSPGSPGGVLGSPTPAMSAMYGTYGYASTPPPSTPYTEDKMEKAHFASESAPFNRASTNRGRSLRIERTPYMGRGHLTENLGYESPGPSINLKGTFADDQCGVQAKPALRPPSATFAKCRRF